MRNRAGLFAVGLLATVPLVGGAQDRASPRPASDSATAPVAFWQALGDTTLARLTARALEANHDVRLAEARVRQARAARATVALDRAPIVTVAAGYTRQRIADATFGIDVPDRGLWDTELRAAWEIDVFGRLRRTLRGQEALTESARQDLRDVQRVLAADVALAYYDLRGAEDQLRVARRNAENQRRTLELTRDRLDAGRGTEFDTERALAQLATTRAGIPLLETRIAAARHRIAVLLGGDPRSLQLEPGCDGPPALPDSLPAMDADALVRARPDVRAAERRLAAETAFVGAARADYLPRFGIGGTAGFTSTGLGRVGGSGSSRYAIGPVITWPAFDLGRVKARVEAARAIEAEARARYEEAVLRAREELENGLVAYARARDRLDELTAAASASERAAELARLRFEGGVSDFLQVLDAERSVLAAQDRLAEGRTDAVAALVVVYRAMNGSFGRGS